MTMTLGTQTGSLINHLYAASTPKPPVVGDGATILCWSDRHAGTIIQVFDDGGFIVQEDTATRTDSNGMSDAQSYTYSRNENGRCWVFRTIRRGKAKGQLGENGRKGGAGVIVGRREKHHDFSF